MVDNQLCQAQYLASPTAPNKKIGFFYAPIPVKLGTRSAGKLLACDLPSDPASAGRVYLKDNGDTEWIPESLFQDWLGQDENREFTKFFHAAQKQ